MDFEFKAQMIANLPGKLQNILFPDGFLLVAYLKSKVNLPGELQSIS